MTRPHAIVNMLLALACAGITAWIMLREPERRSAGSIVTRSRTEASAENAGRTGAGEKNPVAAALQNVEVLHKRSLFNPQRSEQLEASDDDKTDKPDSPMDMELIGVGVIGEKAAAVILVSNPRSGNRRGAASGKSSTRHVYRLGQTVEETGYEITDITLSEVFLSRGDEERVLRLQTSDKSSSDRKAKAARHAAAQMQKQRAKAEERKPDDTPPPPLPAHARAAEIAAENKRQKDQDNGNEGAEKQSREERIKRALEARRRIIERRRKEQAENNN